MSKAICEQCGQPLITAPARYEGEATFVGYLPHNCTNKDVQKAAEEAFPEAKRIGFLAGTQWKGEESEALKKEIERLKGLIEDAYIQGRNDEKGVSEIIGWQQFKSENNL